MPNTFIDNRDAWLRLSDVDYLGQFVKAWLAFNAWYRSAYTETQDRKIINEIKWNPNPISNKFRPLLAAASEEAEQFRSDVGNLHHRLENYEIRTGKGDDRQRISLLNVFLKDNPPCAKTGSSYGFSFSVQRANGGQISIDINGRNGAAIYQYQQVRFDLVDLQAHVGYVQLSLNQQSYLRQLYEQVNPKEMANLADRGAPIIQCGAHRFHCTRNDLFAGLIEVLYLLRCTLFHGELSPTKEAAACYEPAYRLIRRFLDSIN